MPSLSNLVDITTKKLEHNEDLTQKLLTSLVESLIASEVKPGGPYQNNGVPELLLNARILKLFLLLNKPMPDLELFVNKQVNDDSKNISAELELVLLDISKIKEGNLAHSEDGPRNSDYDFYFDYLETLTPEVNITATEIGKKIIKADSKGEITQLSSSFQNSIYCETKLNARDLILLGQINFLVWSAYSIYDAVIDGDLTPGALSSANILSRRSLQLYLLLPIDFNLVLSYFSRVDCANAWETSNCRFDKKSDIVQFNYIPTEDEMKMLLSNRAIAHILGPISITTLNKTSSLQLNNIQEALEYYCIARQLNDDLHDWVEDFNNSRITIVVAALLNKAKVKSGIYETMKILTDLKYIFYETELDRICLMVEDYISKSIKLFIQAGVSDKNGLFIDLYVKPIACSARKARKAHQINKMSVANLSFDNEHLS